MKNSKQRLFEMMEAVNTDFRSSTDITREINQEKNANRDANRYTPEEAKEIDAIESELSRLGLTNNVEYNVQAPQDEMGTKNPRYEFLFWIKKLNDKFGHANIDKLLANTNLIVQNPQVGSAVHGYILRNLSRR
jgi:hypothetical protein